jgi:hypothetical protein
MSEQTIQKPRYMVNVYEAEETGSPLIFTFVLNGLHQVWVNGASNWVPEFNIKVRQETDGLIFDWSESLDEPGDARDEVEAEITARMKDRSTWIDRVTSLVGQVEQWAREMGWSTRRLQKELEDERIGKHRVPALLMQQDTYRILLEPIGRSTAGAEGVVDLYLIPAYDDIASLYYYENRWNLHYMFPGTRPVAAVRETEPRPLSKETLEEALAEMRRHAA